MNYLRVKLDIILASKGTSATYKIVVPIGIYQNERQELSWNQEGDENGRKDPRLPDQGFCQPDGQNNLLLQRWVAAGNVNEAVATLENFPIPSPPDRGVCDFGFEQAKAYAPAAPGGATTTWKGRGTWTVLDRKWAPNPADFLVSKWKFKTSGGAGGGVVLAASGGTFILIDPSGSEWSFTYGGIGVGVSVSKIPLPKKLPSLPTSVPIPKLPGKTGTTSGGTTGMWNVGAVLKQPITVGTAELTKESFTGPCVWADAGAVLIGGFSGACMFLGCNPLAGPLMGYTYKALIPSFGQAAGLNIGAGAYGGWVWGAW